MTSAEFTGTTSYGLAYTFVVADTDPFGVYLERVVDQVSAALEILSQYIKVSPGADLELNINSLAAGKGDRVLASAGLEYNSRTITGDVDGLGRATYDTIAARKLIDGIDGNGRPADGNLNINTSKLARFWFDTTPDIRLDNAPISGEFDFLGVILHEIFHMLGMSSTFSYSPPPTGLEGLSGYLAPGILVYDQFIQWDELQQSFVFAGETATRVFGDRVPLVSRGDSPGSDLSHVQLDSTVSLMNAAFSANVVPQITSLELAILNDLGFSLQHGLAPLFLSTNPSFSLGSYKADFFDDIGSAEVYGFGGDDIFEFGEFDHGTAAGGGGDDVYYLSANAVTAKIDNSGDGRDTIVLPYQYIEGGFFSLEGIGIKAFTFDDNLLLTDLETHWLTIPSWTDSGYLLEEWVDAGGNSWTHQQMQDLVGQFGAAITMDEYADLTLFSDVGVEGDDLKKWWDVDLGFVWQELFAGLVDDYADGQLTREEIGFEVDTLLTDPLAGLDVFTEQEFAAFLSMFSAAEYPSIEDNVFHASVTLVDPHPDNHVLYDSSIETIFDVIPASEAQLYRMYYGGLGRVPDQQGFAWWLNEIAEGRQDLQGLGRGFLASMEFVDSVDSNRDGFVADVEMVNYLYETVLSRAPDEDGYRWWLNELATDNNDLAGVLIGFVQSNEFVEQSQFAVADYVFL